MQTKILKCKEDGGGNGDFDCYINTDDWEMGGLPDERAVVLEYGLYENEEDVISYEEYLETFSHYENGVTGYFEMYGIVADIIKCSVDIEYETRAYFFTLENAREYIKYQAHNLNEPRIYSVTCGYANKGEYEPFYDLLMSIGVKLLGGDCK